MAVQFRRNTQLAPTEEELPCRIPYGEVSGAVARQMVTPICEREQLSAQPAASYAVNFLAEKTAEWSSTKGYLN
jgi:hypothetical protein